MASDRFYTLNYDEPDNQRSRELIRTVIAEYDERSLVADLPALEDKEATFRHIDNQLSGFGALQDYFDDPLAKNGTHVSGCCHP